MDEERAGNIFSLLKKIDFLYDLNEEELKLLFSRLKKQSYARGKEIIKQGDLGDAFFIIYSGKVSVWRERPDGSRVLIRNLGEANFFGEMSLLTGDRRAATVTAEEDTAVYILFKNDFKLIFEKNPNIMKKISNIVSMRNEQLTMADEGLVDDETLHKRISDFFRIK